MKTSKIIIILAFGLILMACKNETLELKNKVPLCSITSPENNSLFAINEDITINILANDSDGFIENVKLLVDSVEYGVTKISPYKFIVKNNELTLGQHSLIAVATDNKGATKNDPRSRAILSRGKMKQTSLPHDTIVRQPRCYGQS